MLVLAFRGATCLGPPGSVGRQTSVNRNLWKVGVFREEHGSTRRASLHTTSSNPDQTTVDSSWVR